MSRIVQYEADCENCSAPLTLWYGSWSHHWLYANACRNPKAVNATEDGVPIDPETLRPLRGQK